MTIAPPANPQAAKAAIGLRSPVLRDKRISNAPIARPVSARVTAIRESGHKSIKMKPMTKLPDAEPIMLPK